MSEAPSRSTEITRDIGIELEDYMARILVIEDNPANMKLASLLLHNVGHTVLCATDAETGLTLARTHLPNLI